MKKQKKQYNVRYNCGDGVIEIVIRDQTGRKEAKFVANQSDTLALERIGSTLKEKYGIDLSGKKKTDFFGA